MMMTGLNDPLIQPAACSAAPCCLLYNPSASSKMASTSTAQPRGRLAVPTAERAALPRAPNTSTMVSLKPFITSGCCVKSAVLFTNPVTFTTRLMWFRDPSCALSTASMVSAQARAAALPASTPTTPCSLSSAAPTLPTCDVASGARGPMPDTYTVLPTITTGEYTPPGAGAGGSSSGGCSTTRSLISGVPSACGGASFCSVRRGTSSGLSSGPDAPLPPAPPDGGAMALPSSVILSRRFSGTWSAENFLMAVNILWSACTAALF
mmetsp:Transcript_6164/g.15715  ORF Transcript_6164/g.15715 Transcript_6164/m.15715 type:complete len:265 (-) Transcript_6164:933-1727(-)